MRRGEIWTVLADGYARKPRPVVVVQNDEIEGLTLRGMPDDFFYVG